MILATSAQRAFGFVIPRRRGVGFVVWFNLRPAATRSDPDAPAPNRSLQLTDDEPEGTFGLTVALFSAWARFAIIVRRPAVLAG